MKETENREKKDNPVGDAETLKALRDDSALTLYGEPTDRELAG